MGYKVFGGRGVYFGLGSLKYTSFLIYYVYDKHMNFTCINMSFWTWGNWNTYIQPISNEQIKAHLESIKVGSENIVTSLSVAREGSILKSGYQCIAEVWPHC